MNKYEIQENFLKKLAEAYTTYNEDLISDLIDDNFKYSSMWVLQELKSKTEYLDYIKHKLVAMKKLNKKTNFVMMYIQGDGQPVLMLSPKTPDGDFGVFIATSNKDGKISSLNLMGSSLYPLSYKDKKAYDDFLKITNE